MSIRPPNIVRGSGVVTRDQLLDEEAKARRAAEVEAQRQRIAAQQAARRRRRSPSRRAIRAAEEANKKAEAAAKEQRKAQKEEEYRISIGAFREAEKEGEKQGIDITGAKVRITRETGSVKVSASGVKSEAGKKKERKDAEQEAAFETFRALDKEAGGKVSQLKTRSRSNSTTLKVTGYKTEGLSMSQKKNISRLREDVFFTEAASQRDQQIGKALKGARPEYREDIEASLIRESKRAKPGEVFDAGSLDQFVSDLNYSFDVAKGRGAADDVTYTPVKGIAGRNMFEGFDSFGQRQTMIIKPRTVTTTYNLDITGKQEDQRIGLPNDPVEAFKAPFENIYESARFSISDLFGGREIQRTTFDTKTGEIVKQTGTPKLKGEVEGAFTSDLIDFSAEKINRNLLGGGRSDPLLVSRPNMGVNQFLGNFAAKLDKENPDSVKASLLASGILFVPDLLLGGGKKIGTFGSKAFASVMGAGTKLRGGIRVGKTVAEVGSPEVYSAIQKARPKQSAFKFFVNYEPKKELAEIGRGFDFGESGIRRGALLDDEVTIVKEFERAPVGRFQLERRPSVFGQTKPISIEEELDLVRLNPSKPGKLPTLGQIAKPEKVTPPRLAEGAPIKFSDQSGLPKLADIVKPDIPSKPSFAGFPAVRKLPKYTDIIKESKTPRSFAGFPEVRKLPKINDIVKPDIATPKTPFTFGTVRKVPKLADILKPGSRKAKKAKKPEFASDIANLLDTLEGKKAIEPARNLLTRKEQGALAGDILEGLAGETSRAANRRKKITTLSDIDKAIRDQQRGASGFGDKVVKSGRGSSVILEAPKVKPIAPPVAPKKGKGASRDIFGQTAKKGSAPAWLNGLLPKSQTGQKEKKSSKSSQSEIVKSLIGTAPKQRGANLLGFQQRSKESVLQFPKQTGIQIQRPRSRTKTKIDSAFKLDFGSAFKFESGTKQTTRQRRIEIFPNPSRTRTKLIPDIPGIRTPRIPKPKLPPAGGRAKGRGRKKDGGRYQLRSFEVKDVLSATLGTENKFAKDFNKAFGEIY